MASMWKNALPKTSCTGVIIRSASHDWSLDRRQERSCRGSRSRSQEVWNPATGVAEKRVLLADKAPSRAAIASSEKAFPAWRATQPAEARRG